MAIQITVNLNAVPQQVTLPANVSLQQQLLSNQVSEAVIVEYSMTPAHEIWFELQDGSPSKTVTFTDTAANTGTNLAHGVRLIRHLGSPLNGTVGIDERITDEAASHTLDHTFVGI